MVNCPFGPQRASEIRGLYEPPARRTKNVLGAICLVALSVLLFTGWTASDQYGGGVWVNLLVALLWAAGVGVIVRMCGWWSSITRLLLG